MEPLARSNESSRPAGTIRILIADDHPLVLDGLRSAIGAEPGMEVVGEAADGYATLGLYRDHRPDITLLDLQMPRMNGLETIAAIREIDPEAKIIVLTTYSGDIQAARALKAGALGYILKASLRKELIVTIREVADGRRHVASEISRNLAENLSSGWLSRREIEVLRGVARGHANKVIAGGLGITEETVKGHMSNILAKLHANDRTHAVMIALQRGFLDG